MGAFNEWTRGTFLAQPVNRSVVTVANNLLHGAAVMQRLNEMGLACVEPRGAFYAFPNVGSAGMNERPPAG